MCARAAPNNPLIHMLARKPHHKVAYARRCESLVGALHAVTPLAERRLVKVSDREAALSGLDRVLAR